MAHDDAHDRENAHVRAHENAHSLAGIQHGGDEHQLHQPLSDAESLPLIPLHFLVLAEQFQRCE